MMHHSVRPAIRAVLAGTLLALFASSLPGCSAERSAEELVDAARAHRAEGDLRAAILELKGALRQAPDDLSVRALLGENYVETGDGAAAEKELRRALSGSERTLRLELLLVRALLQQEKFAEVLAYEPAAGGSDAATQAELATLRGRAHLGLGDKAAADAAFDEALALVADYPPALVGKAQVLAALGDRANADRWLDRAVEAAPGLAEAWSLRGDLRRREGDLEAAEAAYGKAIEARFDNAGDHLRRALVRIHRQDYAGAEADVKTVAPRRDDAPIIKYLKGLIALGRDDADTARTLLLEVQSAAPGHAGSLYYLGVLAVRDKRFEQAEEYLARLLTAEPEADEAALLLVRVRILNGDLEGAETVLRPVLQRNPDDQAMLELMAELTLAQGRTGEAERLLSKLSALQPDSAPVLTKLGLGLLIEGDETRARAALQRAAAVEEALPRAKVLLVFSFLSTGEYASALEIAERMVEADPKGAGAIALKGTVLSDMGDRAAARTAFEEAWRLEPGHFIAGRMLAQFAGADGDVDAARRYLEAVLEKQPGNVPVSMDLARMALANEDLERFIRLLREAIAANPDDPRPRVMLGHQYWAMGRPDEAFKLLEEPSKHALNNGSFLELAGMMYQGVGNYARALEFFDRLVMIAPQTSQMHFYRALALQGEGRTADARTALQTALELDADNLNALSSLAALEIREGHYDAAQALLVRIESVDDSGNSLLDLRARYHASKREFARAAELKALLMEREPARQHAVDLVELQFLAGQPDAALATAEAWLAQDPKYAHLRLVYADFLGRLGRTAEAREAYEQVLKDEPLSVAALNNLANLLQDSEPEVALGYAREAYEISRGEVPAAADTYGWLLLRQGSAPNEALDVLRKAYSRASGDPELAFHYAVALHANDLGHEAVPILERLAAGESDDSAAAQRLLQQIRP